MASEGDLEIVTASMLVVYPSFAWKRAERAIALHNVAMDGARHKGMGDENVAEGGGHPPDLFAHA